MSIEAFGHADLGLLLGVIAIAAGLEAGAHEPCHALDFGHATALGGGVALYLVSDAWFRQRLRIRRPWPRVLAAIPAIATVAVGLWVAAAAQVATLVVVFAVLFALESRRSADQA
jgi:low temperature requirement protein LtrA